MSPAVAPVDRRRQWPRRRRPVHVEAPVSREDYRRSSVMAGNAAGRDARCPVATGRVGIGATAVSGVAGNVSDVLYVCIELRRRSYSSTYVSDTGVEFERATTPPPVVDGDRRYRRSRHEAASSIRLDRPSVLHAFGVHRWARATPSLRTGFVRVRQPGPAHSTAAGRLPMWQRSIAASDDTCRIRTLFANLYCATSSNTGGHSRPPGASTAFDRVGRHDFEQRAIRCQPRPGARGSVPAPSG